MDIANINNLASGFILDWLGFAFKKRSQIIAPFFSAKKVVGGDQEEYTPAGHYHAGITPHCRIFKEL